MNLKNKKNETLLANTAIDNYQKSTKRNNIMTNRLQSQSKPINSACGQDIESSYWYERGQA
jgi:hypothetical protein